MATGANAGARASVSWAISEPMLLGLGDGAIEGLSSWYVKIGTARLVLLPGGIVREIGPSIPCWSRRRP